MIQANSHATFHVVPEVTSAVTSETEERDNFLGAAVFLTQKIYKTNLRQPLNSKIIIIADSTDLKNLDDKLWTLIPESFLPHSMEPLEPLEFVETSTLTRKTKLSLEIDLVSDPLKIRIEENLFTTVIYLSGHSVPEFFFASIKSPNATKTFHVHHIVGKNTEYREFCRTLFREYKKNGISPSSHQLDIDKAFIAH